MEYDITMSKRHYIHINNPISKNGKANDDATRESIDKMLPKNFPGKNTFIFYDDFDNITMIHMNTKKQAVYFIDSVHLQSFGDENAPVDAFIYIDSK